MPTVTIVRPNISPEERKKVLRNIAAAMERIVEEEYGVKVKIKLEDKLHE